MKKFHWGDFEIKWSLFELLEVVDCKILVSVKFSCVDLIVQIEFLRFVFDLNVLGDKVIVHRYKIDF